MALMGFRESNRVRWVGVRPGHDGTQVVKSGSVNNGALVLHTVSAGKTFFLTDWSLSAWFTGLGLGELSVRDDGDVFQYQVQILAGQNAGDEGAGSMSLPFPIEIPAGWDVYLYADTAGVWVAGFVHGWEE